MMLMKRGPVGLVALLEITPPAIIAAAATQSAGLRNAELCSTTEVALRRQETVAPPAPTQTETVQSQPQPPAAPTSPAPRAADRVEHFAASPFTSPARAGQLVTSSNTGQKLEGPMLDEVALEPEETIADSLLEVIQLAGDYRHEAH